MLKDSYKDEAEIPKEMRALYVKADDGTFILDREGRDGSDSGKVKDFRERNLKLEGELKEVRAQLGKLKDIDPEKYAEAVAALEKLGKLEEGDLLKSGKLDEVLAKRTENMRSDLMKKLEAKDKAYLEEKARGEGLDAELTKMKIQKLALDELSKAGYKLRSGAHIDLSSRIERSWKLDDNRQPFAFKNGNPTDKEFGNKGGEPITMEEWLAKTFESAPYLVEPSQGGGAQGSGARGGDSGHVRTVDRNDKRSFFEQVEKIATNEVDVR